MDDFNRLQEELAAREDDYKCVCLDFEKCQGMLVEAARREVKLQKSLTDAVGFSQYFYMIKNKIKYLN